MYVRRVSKYAEVSSPYIMLVKPFFCGALCISLRSLSSWNCMILWLILRLIFIWIYSYTSVQICILVFLLMRRFGICKIERFNIQHEHNKQKLKELFLLLYSLDNLKVKIFPFLLLHLPLDIYDCQWHSVGFMNKEHDNKAWAVVLLLPFPFSLFNIMEKIRP